MKQGTKAIREAITGDQVLLVPGALGSNEVCKYAKVKMTGRIVRATSDDY
jgi:hypothetical protein